MNVYRRDEPLIKISLLEEVYNKRIERVKELCQKHGHCYHIDEILVPSDPPCYLKKQVLKVVDFCCRCEHVKEG